MPEIPSNFYLFLLNIVFMAVIAVLGFLVKRSIQQIDHRLEEGDEKFKNVTGAIAELKEKRGFDREYFSKEYVAKDDFIRDIRALDVKIDGVAQDVRDVSKDMKELLTRSPKENP